MREATKANLRAVLCVSIATAIFCLGAVYNRYPIFYPDTVSYLFSSKFFEFQGDRPVFYSLWLAFGHATFSTFWFSVVVQSLTTALLIRCVMQVHGVYRLNLFHLLTCALLALVTGICWHTGRLMPDAFTAPMVLSFYLLIFCRDKIGNGIEEMILPLVLFSLLVHYSHLPILAAVFAILWIGFLVRGRKPFTSPPWLLLCLILFAVPLAVTVNRSLGLGLAYSKNPYAFLLSRMVEDGSVSRFLEKKCGEEKILFCDSRAYVSNQTAAGFLWGELGPFRPGESQAPEYLALIFGIFKSDPWGQIKAGLKEFGRQILIFGSADGTGKFIEGGWELNNLRRVSSWEFDQFTQSRQQQGELLAPIILLNKFYYLFFWLAVAFLLVFFSKRVAGFGRERRLALIVGLFLLTNAFVCGVLSGANGRYQSRVAWLPVFAALLILIRWIERRRASG